MYADDHTLFESNHFKANETYYSKKPNNDIEIDIMGAGDTNGFYEPSFVLQELQQIKESSACGISGPRHYVLGHRSNLTKYIFDYPFAPNEAYSIPNQTVFQPRNVYCEDGIDFAFINVDNYYQFLDAMNYIAEQNYTGDFLHVRLYGHGTFTNSYVLYSSGYLNGVSLGKELAKIANNHFRYVDLLFPACYGEGILNETLQQLSNGFGLASAPFPTITTSTQPMRVKAPNGTIITITYGIPLCRLMTRIFEANPNMTFKDFLLALIQYARHFECNCVRPFFMVSPELAASSSNIDFLMLSPLYYVYGRPNANFPNQTLSGPPTRKFALDEHMPYLDCLDVYSPMDRVEYNQHCIGLKANINYRRKSPLHQYDTPVATPTFPFQL